MCVFVCDQVHLCGGTVGSLSAWSQSPASQHTSGTMRMGANTTKPTFPRILVILKPHTITNADINTSEIKKKKKNSLQWHVLIACSNSALSVQGCGPMEITAKSTQKQEASSCWAGGQTFTHQSSVEIKVWNFSFILPEFFFFFFFSNITLYSLCD